MIRRNLRFIGFVLLAIGAYSFISAAIALGQYDGKMAEFRAHVASTKQARDNALRDQPLTAQHRELTQNVDRHLSTIEDGVVVATKVWIVGTLVFGVILTALGCGLILWDRNRRALAQGQVPK